MGSDLTADTGVLSPAGASRAAAWSVLTRGIQAAATLAVVLLVGVRLGAETRGYFFACLGLIAFLPLAEFGVSPAVMQSASHDMARLRWTSSGLDGEPEALRHVAWLLRSAQRWNVATTLAGVVILGTAGTAVLLSGGRVGGLLPPHLLAHWGATLFFAGTWQLLSPRVALLEGSGRVQDVWRFRFWQETGGGAALALALLAGLGLLSLAVGWAVRVAHAAAWLLRRDHMIPRPSVIDVPAARTHWREQVWSFQWRIGISTLCGFLLFQLFTPALLASQGAVAAGRFGMSFVIANGLLSATSAWMTSQAPHFGSLIASRRFVELDRDFARAFGRSTALAVFGAVAILGGAVALTKLSPAAASRLLAPATFGLLLAAAVVNHLVFGLSVYLRAHRREPLLVPSVVGAIVTAAAVIWASRVGGPALVAALYLGLTVAGFATAVGIFVVCRRRWHLQQR